MSYGGKERNKRRERTKTIDIFGFVWYNKAIGVYALCFMIFNVGFAFRRIHFCA